MTRDMDLIRALLRDAEARGPLGSSEATWAAVDGYDARTIAYHVKLMEQAGLVEAHVLEPAGMPPVAARIFSLTWAGHDWLEAVKNETVWARTKALIAEKGGGATLEVVKAVAVKVAFVHFGLST